MSRLVVCLKVSCRRLRKQPSCETRQSWPAYVFWIMKSCDIIMFMFYKHRDILSRLFCLLLGMLVFEAALFTPGAGAEEASLQKISGILKLVSAVSKQEQTITRLSEVMEIYPEGAEPSVGVVIRTFGPLWELREMGITLRSNHGNVATATVPLSQLDDIAALDSVQSIEPSMVQRATLDLSVPETGADTVHSGTPPFTGRGVVVGVCDTGINVNHDDFKDEAGKSRILFLWDQLVDQEDIPPAPPAGYDYGIEYTADDIDNDNCPHIDYGAHGSHVAGTAAGNGLSTGGKYKGMAPDADIIFVDCFSKDGGGTSDAFYLDGIDYIRRKAESMGKPYVINLSLGGMSGPHDGTTSTEIAINNDIDSGATIVIAAGNSGNDKIHAKGRLLTGSQLDFEFMVATNQTLVAMDIWYDGDDQIQITMYGPTVTLSGVIPGNGEMSAQTADANVLVGRAHPSAMNNDNEYVIYLQPPEGGETIATRDWKLRFEPYEGNALSGGGWVDAWIYSGYAVFSDTDDISYDGTLGMPATAEQAISIASYNTKTSWDSKQGPMDFETLDSLWNLGLPLPIQVHDRSWFSSRGPTRDERYVKPELSAPGCNIAAALAPEGHMENLFVLDENPADQHQVMYGTSMAAPHVTGGIALLLQKNPKLTPRQIKEALINSVKTDAYTGAVPNTLYGYGKMDIPAAIGLVPLPEGTDPYGTITLVPVSSSLHADGDSSTTVVSEVITDASGTAVPDGHKITVTILYGDIDIRKVYAQTSSNELELVCQDGIISFEVVAGDLPGKAKLKAQSNYGNAFGTMNMTLTTQGSLNTGDEIMPEGVRACFIASAAFYSPLAQEVITLKQFRDRYLKTNYPGSLLVSLYYRRIGPPTARILNNKPTARNLAQSVLRPAVAYARWSLSSSPGERFGLGAILLICLACLIKHYRARIPDRRLPVKERLS